MAARLRFGFFDQLPCTSSNSEFKRVRQLLSQIRFGETLGFDTAWLGELHFSREASILSAPFNILSAAAQATKRIRLGSAVSLLPIHNPIRLAEEVATVDLLSNGRVEFGIGRGASPRQYHGFGISQEESRERLEESLNVILGAWAHETFTYRGKYFQAEDVSVVPRPIQKPHPPIRLAANSADTFELAGRLGLPVLSSPITNSPQNLRDYLSIYRNSLATGTNLDVSLMFFVHVSSSRKQARLECERSLMNFFRVASARLQPLARDQVRTFEAYQNTVPLIELATYENVEPMCVFGDADYCVNQIQKLRENMQMNEFIAHFNMGGLIGPNAVRNSMRLFAEQVLTRLD